MVMDYAVAFAGLVGMMVGASVAAGLGARRTPKACIVTEVAVNGNMEVFQRDYAAVAVFDSCEKTQAWPNSPEYKKICVLRECEATSRRFIVEAIPDA